jgi:hypothetical protein
VRSAGQEIPDIWWNHFFNEQKKEPAIGLYVEPVEYNADPHNLFHTIMLSSHICLILPSGQMVSYSDFSTRILYILLISRMHAICSTHLIILDLINLMICGEEYKL